MYKSEAPHLRREIGGTQPSEVSIDRAWRVMLIDASLARICDRGKIQDFQDTGSHNSDCAARILANEVPSPLSNETLLAWIWKKIRDNKDKTKNPSVQR
ncbi:hypothetical protein DdX_16297 [Ditylenchus destructor]|uniref:Uncharacterized protein n=1 Tax=Ditylenchus destructor TaxID=166010 RepID=A0AAD4R079_9BILA|nr:hypothetical protein DdX_16297 [Ditylenchus destructor]